MRVCATISILIMTTVAATAECVSRQACIDSHAGYCKYRNVNGERCWFATKDGEAVAVKQRPKRTEIAEDGKGGKVSERHRLDDDPDPEVWPKASEWKPWVR